MKKLPLAELLVAGLILAAGVAVYVYAHRDEGAIEATKQRGALIVGALREHHAAEGRYPAALDALVPAYLDSIPAPAWGDRWTYRTFGEGAHCELYVREPAGRLTLRYDFTGERWALDN